jgi:hypothetical protein
MNCIWNSWMRQSWLFAANIANKSAEMCFAILMKKMLNSWANSISAWIACQYWDCNICRELLTKWGEKE